MPRTGACLVGETGHAVGEDLCPPRGAGFPGKPRRVTPPVERDAART